MILLQATIAMPDQPILLLLLVLRGDTAQLATTALRDLPILLFVIQGCTVKLTTSLVQQGIALEVRTGPGYCKFGNFCEDFIFAKLRV